MRTIISLDDDLHRRAKAYAAKTGTTLTALVEEALRAKLAARPRAAQTAGAAAGVRGHRASRRRFAGSLATCWIGWTACVIAPDVNVLPTRPAGQRAARDYRRWLERAHGPSLRCRADPAAAADRRTGDLRAGGEQLGSLTLRAIDAPATIQLRRRPARILRRSCARTSLPAAPICREQVVEAAYLAALAISSMRDRHRRRDQAAAAEHPRHRSARTNPA